MALSASNKMENIKASLEKYFFDNLVTTESLTVEWQGSPGVNLENINSWVHTTILRGGQQYLRQVSDTEKGNNTEILLNVNIFVRKGSTNYHRLSEMRDIVANYFQEDQTITFTDYQTGGNPQIGTFVVREIITDMEVPTGLSEYMPAREYDTLFFQWNFTVLLVTITKH